MNSGGFNPMRWNCGRDGCFNVVKRPKIELFADCLPGKIAFSDVDGITEINGKCLMLEFKPAPVTLQAGQRIMFTRLSNSGIVSVILLAGDAQTMQISHMAKIYLGRWHEWRPATLDEAKGAISAWAQWAQSGRRERSEIAITEPAA